MATVSCGAHCSEAGYLKEGILRGAFNFKVASAWASVRSEKIQLSVLLPSGESVDDWLEASSNMTHSWPQFLSISPHCKRHVAPKDLHALRGAVRGRHVWRPLRPQWSFLSHHLYATGLETIQEQPLGKLLWSPHSLPGWRSSSGIVVGPNQESVQAAWQEQVNFMFSCKWYGLVSLASPRRKQWSD